MVDLHVATVFVDRLPLPLVILLAVLRSVMPSITGWVCCHSVSVIMWPSLGGGTLSLESCHIYLSRAPNFIEIGKP